MAFKAIELEEKPFLIWQETNQEPGGLVVAAMPEPAFQYGVSTWEIVEGELVARDMTPYEQEYTADKYSLKLSLYLRTFDYDGKVFPMHERARLYYGVIEHNAIDYNVMTVTGEVYPLAEANIGAFLSEYYKELQSLTQPEI